MSLLNPPTFQVDLICKMNKSVRVVLPPFVLLVDKTKPKAVTICIFISICTPDLQYSIEVDFDKLQHGMTPRGQFRISTDTLTDIVTNITTLTYDQRKDQEVILVLNVSKFTAFTTHLILIYRCTLLRMNNC